MTIDEIIASYRRAENKKKQIGILADLCDTSREAIRETLRRAGVLEELPEKPPERKPSARRRRTKSINEAQGRALFEEGLSDEDAAERLGVTPQSYTAWRTRHGLLRRGRKPDIPAEALPVTPAAEAAVAAVDLEEFAASLSELAQRYPGLTLTVMDKPITGAELRVRLGISGSLSAELRLEVGTDVHFGQ